MFHCIFDIVEQIYRIAIKSIITSEFLVSENPLQSNHWTSRILFGCSLTSFTPNPINDITYVDGDPIYTATLPSFTLNDPNCGPIVYTLYRSGGSIPPCMTFSSSALTITTYTTNSADRNFYSLELRGSLNNNPTLTHSAFFTYIIDNCDIGFIYS